MQSRSLSLTNCVNAIERVKKSLFFQNLTDFSFGVWHDDYVLVSLILMITDNYRTTRAIRIDTFSKRSDGADRSRRTRDLRSEGQRCDSKLPEYVFSRFWSVFFRNWIVLTSLIIIPFVYHFFTTISTQDAFLQFFLNSKALA